MSFNNTNNSAYTNRTKNTIMLATFTNDKLLDAVVTTIFDKFEVDNNSVFIFCEDKDNSQKILTYNIISNDNFQSSIKQLKRTIRINRKKNSNTLYTINAINKIIEEQGGVKSKEYELDWNKYKNCMLLFDESDSTVSITKTRLYTILSKEDFENRKTAFCNKNPQYI